MVKVQCRLLDWCVVGISHQFGTCRQLLHFHVALPPRVPRCGRAYPFYIHISGWRAGAGIHFCSSTTDLATPCRRTSNQHPSSAHHTVQQPGLRDSSYSANPHQTPSNLSGYSSRRTLVSSSRWLRGCRKQLTISMSRDTLRSRSKRRTRCLFEITFWSISKKVWSFSKVTIIIIALLRRLFHPLLTYLFSFASRSSIAQNWCLWLLASATLHSSNLTSPRANAVQWSGSCAGRLILCNAAIVTYIVILRTRHCVYR